MDRNKPSEGWVSHETWQVCKMFIHCPAQHTYCVGQGLPPLLPELAKMSGLCFRRCRVGLGVGGWDASYQFPLPMGSVSLFGQRVRKSSSVGRTVCRLRGFSIYLLVSQEGFPLRKGLAYSFLAFWARGSGFPG